MNVVPAGAGRWSIKANRRSVTDILSETSGPDEWTVHIPTTTSSSTVMASHDAHNGAWVKLVSSDGYTFLIQRSVAMMSGTLKNMLNFDS